jgi:hypothetical protein
MMKKSPRPISRRKIRPNAPRSATMHPRDVLAPALDEVREEARRRIRSRPGYLASLSPEQLEAILDYDGPEILGPRDSKFRLK